MTELLYTVGAGLISGAFSAGVLWTMVKQTTRTANRAEGKIDRHINDHITGAIHRG